MSIPKTQTAVLVDSLGGPIRFDESYPVPTLKENEVLAEVLYSGVCQSDLHTKNGTASGPDGKPITKVKLPHLGGHEGVGTIVAIHSSISPKDKHIRLNRYVGIRFLSRVCRRCKYCLAAQEQYCLEATNHLHHEDGAFQEYIALDADNLTLLPDDIDPVSTGPTLCAGVTAYKAVLNANIKPGDHVVVLGAAGGLGHYAIQYARANSANVLAIDAGPTKREFLASLGFTEYIDIASTSPEEAISRVHELTRESVSISSGNEAPAQITGAHAVIVTAGNYAAYDLAASLLRTAGTMSCVGIPPPSSPGNGADFPVAKLIIKNLHITGNLVGSMKETLEAVDYVRRGVVKPVIDVRTWRELEGVYESMEKGDVVGRVVVKIGGA